MKNKIKKLISFFLCILIILVGAFGVYIGLREYYKKYYPRDYSQFVEKYSKEFDIDEYLVFSIIKTESDFNPKAVSKDGASGLMQIMPDTYDWIKSKKIDSA
ncbi:MAG: transglycosylase SLT domain-containing protein, partial [Oscillospiraceae bacterium]